ncbi:hypothetical protein CASFOL_022577 [Castilleja foliolosa]|uniref:ATP synthase CF0 subunit I n=1 Tax=Castilleja foliolosa TaxID=1961234 RepID=A0ABD3CUZ4_9LAMI
MQEEEKEMARSFILALKSEAGLIWFGLAFYTKEEIKAIRLQMDLIRNEGEFFKEQLHMIREESKAKIHNAQLKGQLLELKIKEARERSVGI